MERQEIIITRSTTLFWRAGGGLWFILFGVMFAVMLHQPFPIVGPMLALALFAFLFSIFLARIEHKDGAIILTRALSTATIPAGQIVSARIWSLTTNRTAIGFVRRRGQLLPLLFQFVVINHSSCGNFRETVAAVRDLIRAAQHASRPSTSAKSMS